MRKNTSPTPPSFIPAINPHSLTKNSVTEGRSNRKPFKSDTFVLRLEAGPRFGLVTGLVTVNGNSPSIFSVLFVEAARVPGHEKYFVNKVVKIGATFLSLLNETDPNVFVFLPDSSWNLSLVNLMALLLVLLCYYEKPVGEKSCSSLPDCQTCVISRK